MYKVYFVDDAQWLIAELNSIIDWQAEGFTVAGWSTDPETAVREIVRISPALVVSDIRMDGMDGLTLAGTVRERAPDVAFCFLSAYDRFDYAVTAMKLGAVDYLTKPIDADALTAVLRKVSGARREAAVSMLLDTALVGADTAEDEGKLAARFDETELLKGRPRVAVFYGGDLAALAPDETAERADWLYEGGNLIIALLCGAREDVLRALPSRLGVSVGLSGEIDCARELIGAVRAAKQCSEGGASAERSGLSVFVPGEEDYGKEVVSRMIDTVKSDLAGRYSLAGFAALYGYNPSYLSNLFKKTTGRAFVDYVMELRMRKVRRDIASTDKSLREIALGVGYDDYFHFSKLFKKHTGLSPSAFKAAAKQKNV